MTDRSQKQNNLATILESGIVKCKGHKLLLNEALERTNNHQDWNHRHMVKLYRKYCDKLGLERVSEEKQRRKLLKKQERLMREIVLRLQGL